MAEITVKRSGKKKLLLQGDLTLENLSGLKDRILEKELPEDATIDLSGVARFDLPGLQFLYALRGKGRTLQSGENGDRFDRMARFAGLTPLSGGGGER
ncbi:MAG: lipid asymmetry maintenance protein MlaB [Spirochaetaceae bacterium]